MTPGKSADPPQNNACAAAKVAYGEVKNKGTFPGNAKQNHDS
jgi:hypothetical protein